MNVALQHWATVILPLKSNSRSSIYFCASSLEKTKDLPKREVFRFVAKLGFVVRLVLVAMTVALQHLATAHPHSPHKLEICGVPLMGSNPAIYKKIKDLPNGKSFILLPN